MMSKPAKQSPHIRRIAVVGSGLAGITAALLLQKRGHQAVVFEKSRGPGGRLAAKRVREGSADIGAQYFTVRNPDFMTFLEAYAGSESFAEWDGRLEFRDRNGQHEPFPPEPRYVGVPRMTAISRTLSSGLDIRTGTRIEKLARSTSQQWHLMDTHGRDHGPFDAVVITAPPAQCRDLLEASGLTGLVGHIQKPVAQTLPCWAVAAHFQESLPTRFDGMRCEDPTLYWVANNSSKPGRDGEGQWWVLHAGPEWSEKHERAPAEEVARQMVEAFQNLTGTTQDPDEVVSHRWLYARCAATDMPGHLWFAEQGIGLAGDWLAGGRVEGAFNSGHSLVAAMLEG